MGRNSVRIIGGKWRRRRIPLGSDRIRPTPDRVRETLFSWIQRELQGTSVLDLFAGSGALGFESLSRGASHATLVDNDPEAVLGIRSAAASLGVDDEDLVVVERSALDWLSRPRAAKLGVAFIDPPYGCPALRDRAISLIRPLLTECALVYVECRACETPKHYGFEVFRQMSGGNVNAVLLRRRDFASDR